MLVLSRKRDESIVLKDEATGEEVTITVVRIDPNKVRLGIEAGKNTTILRSELVSQEPVSI